MKDIWESANEWSPAVKSVMGQKAMMPQKKKDEEMRKRSIDDVVKNAVADALRQYYAEESNMVPSLMGDETMEGAMTSEQESGISGYAGMDNKVNPETNKVDEPENEEPNEEKDAAAAANKAEQEQSENGDIEDLSEQDDDAANQAKATAVAESDSRSEYDEQLPKRARITMEVAAMRKRMRKA